MLNLNLILNNLSFGHVSICILRELWQRQEKICLLPIHNQIDVSSFKIEPEFAQYIQTALRNGKTRWSRKNPTLKCWHINGSEESVGQEQVAFCLA